MTDAPSAESSSFEGWVILELMGHRRLAGYLSEQQIGGASFLRVDVPGDGGPVATQFYSPAAVYCITPTSETTARDVAQLGQPAPVSRWELPPTWPEPDDEPDVDELTIEAGGGVHD